MNCTVYGYDYSNWSAYRRWNNQVNNGASHLISEGIHGTIYTLKNPEDHFTLSEIEYKCEEWYKNGKFHRDNDLPAVIGNGVKKWYQNGLLHRENDLPAIEYTDRGKEWYKNGNRFRENNLPAVESADGYKVWCINGKIGRENNLPAIESSDGGKEWFENGKRHRLHDLPAIEYFDGGKAWYEKGKLHRNGLLPAIAFSDGDVWCKYGKRYTFEQLLNCYKLLNRFGRYCLKKIKIRRLKKLRYIHNELLCMPPKGKYLGSKTYYKMFNYFTNM